MPQMSASNNKTDAKTNGGGTPIAAPARRENRGRGLEPELRRAIIKSLKAAAKNNESGTQIAKQHGVSSSTVYGLRDEEGIQVLKSASKKKPANQLINGGTDFAARRDRMIALYDAGKKPLEVAQLEKCHSSTAYEHFKRWQKLRGIPASPLAHSAPSAVVALSRTPVDASEHRAITGRSMSAQKAFDLHYDALKNVPAGELKLHEHYFMIGYKMDRSRDVPA